MKFLGVALVIALLTFGCVGSDIMNTQSTTSKLDYAQASAPPVYGAAGQVVTQQGYITIMVPEGTIQERFDDLKSNLSAQSAQVSDISYNELSDRKQYTITIKVPPSRFNDINDMLKGIGEVKDMSVQLQDVTQQYTDLDTQITNRQLELQRLQALYNQSTNVSDLLQVESELTRVETELDSLHQQKQDLVSKVEMSTIVITMYENKPATTQLSLSFESLGAMFFSAIAAAISLIVLAAGFLIPLGIVVGILWFAYKAVAGNRKSKPRPPEHSRIPAEQ